MTDSTKPTLTKAFWAANRLVMRRLWDGSLNERDADELMSGGFTLAVRTLADLRTREGLAEQDITDGFERQVAKAKETGDGVALLTAEFTLAVWGGMRDDLADYLAATA